MVTPSPLTDLVDRQRIRGDDQIVDALPIGQDGLATCRLDLLEVELGHDPLQAPIACTPPSTCTISPVVRGNQSDSSATTARAGGSGSDRSHPIGARVDQTPSNSSNPGIDLAAIVRTGPAATRFTRTPDGPRSRARYRVHDSSAALATPIQSYLGQATAASKSIPTIDAPPSLNSGRLAIANDFSEYAEMCSAVATSGHSVLRKLPPSAASGAYPIECTTPSRPSTCSRTRSASASRCASSVTSSSITGASAASRVAPRSTGPIRPNPVSTTRPPSTWASRAM